MCIRASLCCRHIHPAIDGLLEIMRDENVAPAEVERVEVGTYAVAESHKGVGWGDFCQAQMSFPFVLATAMHRGQVMMEEFTDAALKDGAVGSDTGKFEITVDAECDADYPNLRSAKVRVHTTDGREYYRRIDEPLGATRNPLSDAALDEKVQKLSDPVIGADRSKTVIKLCRNLEEMTNLTELGEALAG